MYDTIIVWVGLALLLVLCLPLTRVQKLVLEISAWALRLALLALLGAAAYLWFRPGELPVAVADGLNDFPRLRALLPDPMTPNFGVCAAALVVAACLPLLAVLDVSRQVAGRRLRRLRALTASPAAEVPPAEPAPPSRPSPALRPIGPPRRPPGAVIPFTHRPPPVSEVFDGRYSWQRCFPPER
jgi:hypothetical protein